MAAGVNVPMPFTVRHGVTVNVFPVGRSRRVAWDKSEPDADADADADGDGDGALKMIDQAVNALTSSRNRRTKFNTPKCNIRLIDKNTPVMNICPRHWEVEMSALSWWLRSRGVRFFYILVIASLRCQRDRRWLRNVRGELFRAE